MNSETPTFSIARVKDLFDRWRQMGSLTLGSGAELIGKIPHDDEHAWLHIVHPGLSLAMVDELEARLQLSLPRDLRAVYRRISGMSLFHGAFRLFGFHKAGFRVADQCLQPDDLLRLNHELDLLGWKPPQALAVAENGWDLSVHVMGLTDDPHTVLRCDRITGRVVEEHPNIWTCLADRLYRLDQLLVDAERPAQSR